MARARNAKTQKCGVGGKGRDSGCVSVPLEGDYFTTNAQRILQNTVQVTVTWPPFLCGIQLPVPLRLFHERPHVCTAGFRQGLHGSDRPRERKNDGVGVFRNGHFTSDLAIRCFPFRPCHPSAGLCIILEMSSPSCSLPKQLWARPQEPSLPNCTLRCLGRFLPLKSTQASTLQGTAQTRCGGSGTMGFVCSPIPPRGPHTA